MGNDGLRKLVLIGIALVLVLIVGIQMLRGSGEGSASKALESGSIDERLDAIGQLQDLGTDAAAEIIARYAGDANAAVARRSVFALGMMQKPQSKDALSKALQDQRPLVRSAATTAILRVDPKGSAADVARMLNANVETSAEVRAMAAQALGAQRSWEAVPDLIAALRDEVPAVRLRASAAVNRIIGADFGFRARDPQEKREQVIAKIEMLWEKGQDALRKNYESYQERLEHKKGSK